MGKLVINQLTPLSVKSLPPGRYTDGQGLQLLVKSSGARSWVMRYRFAGQYRDTGLGNASGLVTVWFRSLEIISSLKETDHVDQAYRRFQARGSSDCPD